MSIPPNRHIDKVDNFIGFAAEDPSDGKVKVICKGFVHSDQKEFYDYIDQISSIFLSDTMIDKLTSFLVIINADSSADLWLNNVPTIANMLSKRSIKAGEIVRTNDIADIVEMRFQDIEIKQEDSIVFCFKKGWKFGLYFNLCQADKKTLMSIEQLYNEMGSCYKYLTFQKEYAVLENKLTFEKMFKDGWFPFIQLIGGDYQKLAKIYVQENPDPEKIKRFMDSFDKVRLDSFTQNWWKKKIFEEKKVLLQAGLEAYLEDTQSGYINCIKTLHSEIDGILRISYFRENGHEPKKFKQLKNYIQKKAKTKFVSMNSLGFPDIFFDYLNEVILRSYNQNTGEIDLSRHSAMHGIAKPEDYTKAKALQAILILDQMFFYL